MIKTTTIHSNSDIYKILKNEIMLLELAPGQFIGEIEIAKRFNVSRTPIREVFKRLEYDNLIKIIPNKGTMINPINLELVSEIMYIREKLEIGIIGDIMPILREDSLTQLKLSLIKQKKLIEDPNKDLLTRSLEFYKIDNQFHKTIFGIANKTEIWDIFINFGLDYLRFRAVSAELNSEDNLKNLYEDHCKIYELIMKKDVPTLKKMYSEHIYSGINLFNRLLVEKEHYFVV